MASRTKKQPTPSTTFDEIVEYEGDDYDDAEDLEEEEENEEDSEDYDPEEDAEDYDDESDEEDEDSEDDHDENPTGSSTTDLRLKKIKEILERAKLGNKLEAMVDFDAANVTEHRISCNKKIIDFWMFVRHMNCDLLYIKSGATGHTFKLVDRENPTICYALKVCAYPADDDYGCTSNLGRPENAELRVIKLLSSFIVEKSVPHFVLPVVSFDAHIDPFVKKIPEKLNLEKPTSKTYLYAKFVQRYKKKYFEDSVSILMSEWCDGGDLLDYLRKNYKTMEVRQWRVIFFQFLISLATIHKKYPHFKHNDLKPNNVLVRQIAGDIGARFEYEFGSHTYSIPNIGISIGIWDFDFACICGMIENNKVNSEWANERNINNKKNRYYDIHFFFNHLTLPRVLDDYEKHVPVEVRQFIQRVVPLKYKSVYKPGIEQVQIRKRINGKVVTIIEEQEALIQQNPNTSDRGRLLAEVEHTTPEKLIQEDPFFRGYQYPLKRASK
jgi:hypothetical protein